MHGTPDDAVEAVAKITQLTGGSRIFSRALLGPLFSSTNRPRGISIRATPRSSFPALAPLETNVP
jgi:hypothetical protein